MACSGGPAGELARCFDLAVVAVTGWSAPLEDVAAGVVERPSLHPDRVRVRVCCAVGDAGVSAVMRTEREPDEVVDLPEPGFGAMVDALRAMWAGVLTGIDHSPAARRAARHAGRHRRTA